MGIVGRVGWRLVVRDRSSVRPRRMHQARRTFDLPVDHGGSVSRLGLAKGSLRLPTEVGSVPVGRQWLRDVLGRECGAGHPAIDDALQALSEILTNAVLHGTGPDVRVAYTLVGEWAEVSVHNRVRPGEVQPRRRTPAPPSAESGRGLDLVEAFSDQWGITVLPEDEIKVWFRVRLA
ncbi:ATP-binding protein [Actinomadura decatromicini]|uniref:ATP-binding protein n=1 Tax=Actinomadura decatromicini TaxID=2604572 RepID=A0A5D3FS47_9ACTN|nr:ATP-binding protein [Actinomadura decatromicini]